MKYWRTPLDMDKVKIPRGEVFILKERCKGCGFCIEYCPKDILEFSKEFNRKGHHYPVVIENGTCVNCNLCEMICPDFAIFSSSEDADEATAETEQKKVADSSAV